jgi:hypothetical protein
VVFLVDLAGLDHDAVEDRAVDAEFELNYKVARIFVQLIGRPALMRGQTRVACTRRRSWVGARDHGQPAEARQTRSVQTRPPTRPSPHLLKCAPEPWGH